MTFTCGYRKHNDLRIKTVKNSCSPVYSDFVTAMTFVLLLVGHRKLTIHGALKNDMNDGRWTWKKLTRPVAENFSPENLNYC